MKESGIEWVGKIPRGWKVKKLKYLVDYIEISDIDKFWNIKSPQTYKFKDAVKWVKSCYELAEIEKNSAYQPLTYLHNFCLQRLGEDTMITARIIGYQDYDNGILDIAQEKIEHWDISEDEYK